MLNLNYSNGLIPVVVQDAQTRDVLMVAYANEEAINLTRKTGYAHYFSRSRRKIWKRERKAVIFNVSAKSSLIVTKIASSTLWNRLVLHATWGTGLASSGR